MSQWTKLLLCNYLNILFRFHSRAQMTGTPWHVTPPAWSRGHRWRWPWHQTTSGYQSSSHWAETAAHRRILLKHTVRRHWKAAASCPEWAPPRRDDSSNQQILTLLFGFLYPVSVFHIAGYITTHSGSAVSHFSSSMSHWVSTGCGRGLIWSSLDRRWRQCGFGIRNGSR